MLTIREIAQLLSVSKTTARRYLQQIGAEPVESRETINGRVRVVLLYEPAVIDEIRAKVSGQSLAPGREPHEPVEPVEPVQNQLNRFTVDKLQAENDFQKREIETLREQIARLDQLLMDERADKANLYSALGETNRALLQSQQLQAMAERRAAELEDKTRQQEPEPPRWAFWRRKQRS